MKWLNVGYGIRQRLHDLLGKYKINAGKVEVDEVGPYIPSVQEVMMSNLMELSTALFGLYSSKAGGSCIFLSSPPFTTSGTNRTFAPFIGITQSGKWVRSNGFTVSVPSAGTNYVLVNAADEIDTSSSTTDFHDGTSSRVIIQSQIAVAGSVTVPTSDTRSQNPDKLCIGSFATNVFSYPYSLLHELTTP